MFGRATITFGIGVEHRQRSREMFGFFYALLFDFIYNTKITRMWANARRDGRPAEYRWRPLFNAVKCGLRQLIECRTVTLPRRESR